MRFLRSVLSGICFLIFGIGGFFIGTVIFPLVMLFSKSNRKRFILAGIIHFSWQIFVCIMTMFGLIKVNIRPEDLEMLKCLKGTIVAASHPSLIDIVILISVIPDALCVVKGDLLKNFWMRHIVRMIYIVNDISVDAFLNNTEKLLKQGFNIIIFPEGTRTPYLSQVRKIHRGFVRLAMYADADILPVLIRNDPPILGKKQKWYEMGSRISVYNLTFFPLMHYQNDNAEIQHVKAKEMADLFLKTLFGKI